MLLTRAKGRSKALRAALGGAHGALEIQLVELPLLEFLAIPHRLPAADWVLITSATVLDFVDPRCLVGARLAVVGPVTRAACAARGLSAQVVAPRALASSLLSALPPLSGLRVLYPRAQVVPPEFEQGLERAGCELVSVAVYKTSLPPLARESLARSRPVDLVLLASGSAARNLVAAGGGDLPVACIGPSTAAVARELGLRVLAVAQPHTSEGLAQAARRALSGRSDGSGLL